MASPTKIAQKSNRAVLPADFAEWDGGASSVEEAPATLPSDFNEFDPSPEPPAAAAKASSTVAVTDRAQRTGAASSVAEPREPARQSRAKSEAAPKREPKAASYEEIKAKSNKTPLFAGVGLVVLVGIGIVVYPKFSHKAVAPTATGTATTAQTASVATGPVEETSAKGNAGAPSTQTSAAAADGSAAAAKTASAPQVSSDMMNQQLNAQSRLSHNMQQGNDKEATPSAGFGTNGMDAMNGGGINGGVFANGKHGAQVKFESQKTPVIAAGVAASMILRKPDPVYPAIAKTARISGVVVLQITISKTGSVTNVKAISGPTLLRQSAQDAVKNWRYRPFLQNNEPVDVETTTSVSFVFNQ
jgi:TonB family protein